MFTSIVLCVYVNLVVARGPGFRSKRGVDNGGASSSGGGGSGDEVEREKWKREKGGNMRRNEKLADTRGMSRREGE